MCARSQAQDQNPVDDITEQSVEPVGADDRVDRHFPGGQIEQFPTAAPFVQRDQPSRHLRIGDHPVDFDSLKLEIAPAVFFLNFQRFPGVEFFVLRPSRIANVEQCFLIHMGFRGGLSHVRQQSLILSTYYSCFSW